MLTRACFAAVLLLAPLSAYAQPSQGRIVAQRARGYAISGRCDLALPIFDQAIELEPSQLDLVRDRGACHERLGHIALAVQDYTAYCDAAPDAGEVPALRERIARLEQAPPAPGPASPAGAPSAGAPAATATILLPPVPSLPSRNEDPFYTPSSEKDSENDDNAKHKSDTEDEPVPSGFEVGLRVGYSLPFGTEAAASKMSDLFSGTVPLWGDAGFRIAHPNLFVGGYFQYAIAFVGGATARGCEGGVKCYAGVLMYGLQAQYHPLPAAPVDPWIGVGIGLEDVKLSASEGGPSTSSSLNGWDFALLQLGGDFHGVGPVVMFGVGEYTGGSANGQSAAIPGQNQALHEWLTFGLRGVYDVAP